ncbi:MAG: L-lysine 6-transaminase [Candidatus Kapabacteria bacterium]|nr:L-lysine 6-transaminase [Candidatus Kapabacteria bacterium]
MKNDTIAEKSAYKPKYYVNEREVFWELKKHMLIDGFDFVPDYERSQGFYYYDKISGRKFLDFFTCFASVPLGLNHPKLLDPSFIEYIGKISLNKPSNSDLYSVEMATFVKTLFKTAVPEHFKYLFMIEGGALAVENALKVAFDWKVRKNFENGYSSEKGHKIIHFKEAFHGRSGYTMSLTNTDPNKVKYFPKFDWIRVINPKLTFPLTEKNIEETIKIENQAIEEIKKAFTEFKDDIAAIIIEPIQCEGGDNHFRDEFLQKLRILADENEALLIFDEIQTGGGLTGTMWVHEQMNVKSDILTFGKKLQVCGILVGERIDEVENNVFRESSRINSTWGGNLTDMVRATKYLEIIEEDNLLNNVKMQGKYLMSRLKEFENKYSHLISNSRGRGLLCAFDMPDSKIRNNFREMCYNEGLLILPCGTKSIRFRPALNITESQLEEGLSVIEKVLQKINI